MSRQPNGNRNISNPSSNPSHLNPPANIPRPISPGSANTANSMSRAERFEDEKKRLIDSCFSKSDPTGQPAESYAGNAGFTVKITKPYYWQAGTSKEKDFFIASAVKIYRKYTKGLVPELKGFDDAEMVTLTGTTNRSLTAEQAKFDNRVPMPVVPPSVLQHNGMSPGVRAESRGMDPVAPPQPPFAQRPQSREESRYRKSPGSPASIHDTPRPGSAMRQPSESTAPPRWAPPATQSAQAPLQAPRPFASQDNMRSQSPARSFRVDQGARPGTSPASRLGQGRTPRPQQGMQMPLQPPSVPSTRSESPGASSLASSTGPTRPQARAASPPRERRIQQPQYPDAQDTRQQPQQPQQQQQQQQQQTNGTGAAAGANLFAATRQRWVSADQRPQSPGAPQLPLIETSQPTLSAQPSSAHPRTGASEASSAGFDFGDAAAIGAITSFWAPGHASAPTPTPPPAIIEEPASPPTPERSARRPPIQDRGMSDAQAQSPLGLRPAPLRSSGGRVASGSVQEDGAGGSLYGTPRDGTSPVPSAMSSAQPTPRTEEPPEIKPLAVSKRQSVDEARPQSSRAVEAMGKLSMPGGFVSAPVGPSPMSAPAGEAGPSQESVDESAALQLQAEEAQEATNAEAERERLEQEEAAAAEAYRPGLGSMIKKSAVREKFKKAAVTANAFKPRPGGAAEKILKAKAEREAAESGEVDGVIGFVPRPGAMSPAPAMGGNAPRMSEEIDRGGAESRAREDQPPQLENVEPAAPKVEVNSPKSPMQKSLDSPGIMGLGVQFTDDGPAAERPDMHLQTPDRLAQQEEDQAQAERDLFEQREARKLREDFLSGESPRSPRVQLVAELAPAYRLVAVAAITCLSGSSSEVSSSPS
ncbi:hypothetical protein LTR56_023196 [Elasticomyces elasticus]|nr:hypothetical protein LTR56_023196 [Elasticomyces elasticus]